MATSQPLINSAVLSFFLSVQIHPKLCILINNQYQSFNIHVIQCYLVTPGLFAPMTIRANMNIILKKKNFFHDSMVSRYHSGMSIQSKASLN